VLPHVQNNTGLHLIYYTSFLSKKEEVLQNFFIFFLLFLTKNIFLKKKEVFASIFGQNELTFSKRKGIIEE
jgi:hypothetical protein